VSCPFCFGVAFRQTGIGHNGSYGAIPLRRDRLILRVLFLAFIFPGPERERAHPIAEVEGAWTVWRIADTDGWFYRPYLNLLYATIFCCMARSWATERKIEAMARSVPATSARLLSYEDFATNPGPCSAEDSLPVFLLRRSLSSRLAMFPRVCVLATQAPCVPVSGVRLSASFLVYASTCAIFRTGTNLRACF